MPTDAELRQPYSVVPFAIGSAIGDDPVTELEIQMPVNPEGGVGTLLRQVRFALDTVPSFLIPTADAVDEPLLTCSLSQIQGQTTVPRLGDGRTMALCNYVGQIASQIGDSGVAWNMFLDHPVWDFGPSGILSIDQTLSVYAQAFGLIVNGTSFWRGQIHYQIVKLSAQEALSIASRQLSA